MIGLDTNVLVRFLVQDDPEQAAAATALIVGLTETEPGFVCREVLVELVWVLERAYGMTRADIAFALDRLLEARELVVEAARSRLPSPRTASARAVRGSPDQMVALAGEGAGCRETASFDRKAAGIPGMWLLGTNPDH
ncbi:MAG: type II toxin-antitoxin system VapC family toxin [Rhodobacter sp.]|nr:type II toxin-antitoxin system VapC family toxin [Rhodobacter sp.]